MQFDQVLFGKVVEAAKAKAAGNKSWVRAVEKAAEALHSNPYIHDEGDGLLILSESGKTYKANGSCQCEAHLRGMACWHRAAAKLVKRYKEAVTAAASPAYQAKLAAWRDGKAPVSAVYEAAIATGLSTTAAEQDLIELREREQRAQSAQALAAKPNRTRARVASVAAAQV